MHTLFLQNLNSRIRFSPETEGTGGGSTTEETVNTGADKNTGDDDGAALAKLIADAVAKETEGLKRKRDELLAKNRSLSDELKNKSAAPQFSDDEVQAFKSFKEKMEKDELLRAIAEGNSDEVISKVTSRTRTEYEAKLAAERAAKEAASEEAKNARSELTNIRIESAITGAAAGVVKAPYLPIVENLIRSNVRVVEGKVMVVDSDGEPTYNNKGEPTSVAELVESFRGTYGDLFVTASGGGANGSGGSKTRPIVGRVTMEDLANAKDQAEYRLLKERYNKQESV